MTSRSFAKRSWEISSRSATPAAAAPPLAAWLWAVAFAALAVAAFCQAARDVAIPPSQAFLAFNQKRADAFARAGERDAPKILLLGNSRLKYGTLGEAELGELAAGLGHGRMRFLRLVNNWAVFEDFAGLEPTLLAARPDVLVLQTELLAQERAEPARAVLLRDYAEWSMVGRGPWNPGDVDQAELQYGTPCTRESGPKALEERRRWVGRWLRVEPDGASAQLAERFVRRALAQQITVILLQVPRTSAMEEATVAENRQIQTAVDRLMAAYPQIRLLAPAGPSDRRYCDLVHMDETGRRSFSRRLLDALFGLTRSSPAAP
ncbi:MAG TPA: hypothetical protein VFV80_03595 [Geminicoccaceae bacterium]|nr:hypothetical protein [Geminicoccaceae bacterium]